MVSQMTIVATALLQMWGKSLFVAQSMADCSPAPALGGSIFLVAVLLLIWKCNILPKLYRQRAPWIFAVTETLITVFLTELVMQLVWCTYERITYTMVQVACYHKAWCEFGLMATITVVGAFASLCVVVEVVCPARIKDSLGEVLDILPVPEGAASLLNYLQDVRSYIMGAIYFSQLTREQRLFAVRGFKLQVRISKITKNKPSKEHQEEKPENPAQEERSEELQQNLKHEQQSTQLQENLEEKIRELKDLQNLLDLQADEYQTSQSDQDKDQNPEPEAEPLHESNA